MSTSPINGEPGPTGLPGIPPAHRATPPEPTAAAAVPGESRVREEPDEPDGTAESAAPAYPQPAPPDERVPARLTIASAAVVLAGAAALGVPYALLWAYVAPDIPLVKVDGGVVPSEAAPEQFVAGDGWFAVLGVAFGLVAALAAWVLARRSRGPIVLLALAVGSVAAGLLAAWLGQRIGLEAYESAVAAAQPGTGLVHPPDLRVVESDEWLGPVPKPTGVPLVAGFAAVVTYTLLAGWSRYSALRPTSSTEEYPEQAIRGQTGQGPWIGEISSGSWVPPDRTGEPAPPARGEGAPPRD